jgi:hypothetical protein
MQGPAFAVALLRLQAIPTTLDERGDHPRDLNTGLAHSTLSHQLAVMARRQLLHPERRN